MNSIDMEKCKSNCVSTSDSALHSVRDFDDEEGTTRNSNIERHLNLKYQFCRDLFSNEFLEANKIEPDWKVAMISGKEYYEGYL